MTNGETNVVIKVAEEMHKAKNKDQVYKIYRQARNWSRYHCYFEEACTSEMCTYLNYQFKSLKVDALKRIQESNYER